VKDAKTIRGGGGVCCVRGKGRCGGNNNLGRRRYGKKRGKQRNWWDRRGSLVWKKAPKRLTEKKVHRDRDDGWDPVERGCQGPEMTSFRQSALSCGTRDTQDKTSKVGKSHLLAGEAK